MIQIDYSKLSKDFKTNPTKEDLYYLYETLNLTREELVGVLGLKDVGAATRLVKRKGVRKSKEKILEILKKNTSFNDPSVQAKCREAIMKKYGGPSATCSEEVKAKVLATNLAKFGMQSSQRHLSERTRDIINSKENFTKFILDLSYEERTYHNIARLLGMHHSQIGKRTRQYGVDHLIHKNPQISQYERDIFNYIKEEYGMKFEFHNRDQIVNPANGRHMELDLFYRPLKLAIEFNSTRWHTDRNNKGENYHELKEKLCKEKGIKLLFLWQKQWLESGSDQKMKEVAKIAIDDFILAAKEKGK